MKKFYFLIILFFSLVFIQCGPSSDPPEFAPPQIPTLGTAIKSVPVNYQKIVIKNSKKDNNIPYLNKIMLDSMNKSKDIIPAN
jgi:hypothetical protein